MGKERLERDDDLAAPEEPLAPKRSKFSVLPSNDSRLQRTTRSKASKMKAQSDLAASSLTSVPIASRKMDSVKLKSSDIEVTKIPEPSVNRLN